MLSKKVKFLGILVIIIGLAVTMASCDMGNGPTDEIREDTYTVSGRVVGEDKKGFDEVSIYLAGDEDLIATTDSEGNWELTLAKEEIIVFRKEGFHFIPSSLTINDEREPLEVKGFAGSAYADLSDVETHRGMLSLNPIEFQDEERLNPFKSAKIREALNFILDRDTFVNIADDELKKYGIPIYEYPHHRYTHVDKNTYDRKNFQKQIKEIGEKYSYDKAKAESIIENEMESFGAIFNEDDEHWYYEGEKVELIFAIRYDDSLQNRVGHKVSDLLKDIGFMVDRKKVSYDELFNEILLVDPKEGRYHLTTRHTFSGFGGDAGNDFVFFYISYYEDDLVHDEYSPEDDKFEEAARKLAEGDFVSWDERDDLFEYSLEAARKESIHVWLYGYQFDYQD